MQEHFNELLEALSKVKGKFLLSSYQNDELLKYVERFGWFQKEVVMSLGTSRTAGRKRIEVLTANYEL